MKSFGCAIDGSRFCDASNALPYITATVGIGQLLAEADIANNFYKFVKKAIKKRY